MENNTVKHQSLGKSLDQVRQEVDSLRAMIFAFENRMYELDDDNFHQIHDQGKLIEKLYAQLDNLQRKLMHRNARSFLSALLFGTGLYYTLKAIRSKIVDLEQRVGALENKKERDG